MQTALLWAAAGTGFTFLMTTLGAASVFLFRKRNSMLLQRVFLGFAAGVMIAASVWSLLIPAIERAEEAGQIGWIPAAGGFAIGVAFLMVLHQLLPHLHPGEDQPEGLPSKWDRPTLLFTAVTLHNIPEGMAVGVVYAGYRSGSAQITAAGALALSLGIAIQNFPEGAIISMPLRAEGTGVPRRCPFRHCGAHRRGADHSGCRTYRPGAAVSVELRGRRHAVCGGGRADPGNVRGRAFRYRNGFLCRGIFCDDGAGRGTGIR